jgi:hypothetical protein
MNRHRMNVLNVLLLGIGVLFLLSSCSTGKKEEKKGETPQGKTVTVDGMETVKGVNPAKSDAPSPDKKPPAPTAPPVVSKTDTQSPMASFPAKPSYSYAPPLSFMAPGFRKKVVILDFENKTTYQEENIGEAVAKRLADRLDASERVILIDAEVVSGFLKKEGFTFESLSELPAMKRAHQALGIQAFTLGTVTDVSLLSSKASETSDQEVSYATAKIEVRLVDASTGNLLRTFIGRSPIFGTKETGEYNRSKAVLRAIEFSLDEVFDGFLRQLDLLDWSTTLAKIEGEKLYLNAGKSSGLRIGDVLEVFEPGKEIIHPATKVSLGWTTGQLKGAVEITDLFGVDAAVAKAMQGQGFAINDVVKSPVQ